MLTDVRLVASDMDHTLLNEQGELPPDFSTYIRKLNDLGIDFVIASGRPMYTLQKLFPNDTDTLSFISDNGGAISYKGELVFKSLLLPEDYRSLIQFTRAHTSGIPVLCALDAAYLPYKERRREEFLRNFYANIYFVENLEEVEAEAVKFTAFFPEQDSHHQYDKYFAPQLGERFSVTIGDTIWIDIMNRGVNKGTAMLELGRQLSVGPADMMAFGDTYNDIEMLQVVGYSYVVANASMEMHQYARYTTDSNENGGVIKVLDALIEANGG